MKPPPSKKAKKPPKTNSPSALHRFAEKSSTENDRSIGPRRKHLDQRLQLLHRRVALLEQQLKMIEDPRFYRACIFGSARIKPDTKIYDDVFELAHLLAAEGIDILTGGGPGLMEAANKGAQLGREEKRNKVRSFGMTIQLDFEPLPNNHLDIKRHHLRFSSRLDDFMRLSHSIVVTPGGVGTLLELFFSWQLIQVRHISPRPLVLLDRSFWSGLLRWIEDVVLGRELIAKSDLESVVIVDTPHEAFEVIRDHRDKRAAESRGPQKA